MVVDDEPLALELLEKYVEATPFLRLQGSYGSALAVLEALRGCPVDLLFCDIQMPGLNGIELSGTTRSVLHAFHQILPSDEIFRFQPLGYFPGFLIKTKLIIPAFVTNIPIDIDILEVL